MIRHYCRNCGKKRAERFMVLLGWMHFTAWVCIVHCSGLPVKIIRKGEES